MLSSVFFITETTQSSITYCVQGDPGGQLSSSIYFWAGIKKDNVNFTSGAGKDNDYVKLCAHYAVDCNTTSTYNFNTGPYGNFDLDYSEFGLIGKPIGTYKSPGDYYIAFDALGSSSFVSTVNCDDAIAKARQILQ